MQGIYGAVRDITECIFSSVLGLTVHETEAPPAVPVSALAGRVRIHGAFEGAVCLHCSDGLARRAATIMFAIPEASPEEAGEAVAELANMAGGNIKALMAEPSELSLPAVEEGRGLLDCAPGTRIVTAVSFECGGEPLVVSLLERAC